MESTRLHIALISEHASPLAALGGTDAGGQNVYVMQVARHLAALGHRVDVLTRRDSPALPPIVELQRGVRVIHIAAGPARTVAKEALLPHMAEFAIESEAAMRRGTRFDVVHANFFMSALVGLQLKARLGLPLVVTFHALGLVRREHQGPADGFPAERASIERRIVHAADRIVAECPQDEADLLRLYDADATNISMVPCGVDTSRFAPGARARARAALGIAPDDFLVLQLGRMVPRKGVDNVIAALGRMRRGQRPTRLLVVGGNTAEPDERATPEIARLREVARRCGVADRVTFLGQRAHDSLRHFYVAADVFVSTPWYEPFGITPLEAMACGVPVIGSDVGGLRYSIVDGATGYLVPAHDPESLARRLEQLRDDPRLAQSLGRCGLRRVRARFTWERVTRQLVDIYRDVADARRPAVVGVPDAERLLPGQALRA
jgi:D-inositol-3-phosphate glycosyltransferase